MSTACHEKYEINALNRAATDAAPRERLTELDSLRGLAALSVVFYHFSLLCTMPAGALGGAFRYAVLQPLTAGHEAVILFFVLSGYVLSLPAINRKEQSYPVFITRRVFRIYLPYLAALSMALLGDAYLHGYVLSSEWFQRTWSHSIEWHLVWQHVAVFGNYDMAQFNTAFWSIVVEMHVSMFFPLLCLAVLRMNWVLSVTFAVMISVASSLGISMHIGFGEVLQTSSYLPEFIVGICLARSMNAVRARYSSINPAGRSMCSVVSAFLFFFGRQLCEGRHLGQLGDLLVTAGASGIILLSLNSSRLRRILLLGPVHFLGRVSYSVYLVHGTVLFALIHLLYGRLRLTIILPLYLVAVILLSAGFYYAIEQPCMKTGRRLSGHLSSAAAFRWHLPQGVVAEQIGILRRRG